MRIAKPSWAPAPAKPLLPASPEAITGVLGHLDEKWSRNALGVQQRLLEAVERDDDRAAKNWAVAAGISTEKVLLMKGRPTEIVANLHAHRHELVDVMDKLAIAARVLDVHQRKGYRAKAIPQDVPVARLDRLGQMLAPAQVELVPAVTSSETDVSDTRVE